MKKSFLTGLALLLPAVLTTLIILFVVNILTKPFQGALESILGNYSQNWSVLFLQPNQVLTVVSKVLALILIVAATLLIGFLGQLLFFHYLLQFGHWLFHRIPFLNKVYKATQEVVGSLFEEQKANFSSVVLIPFPNKDARAIGFITNTTVQKESDDAEVSVFVPGTPNPTMGFMLKFQRHQLEPLDITIDQALKMVVSIGVMLPEKRKV